ncbi:MULTISPECIES: hypothetical protein [unclassified Exiguobacterium]|uniref:hypothetical protein n=1 Tax=unclassified Exiguobacterium TaxID=2644629 RepID=UPI001BE5CCF8|nr:MULTISPECIES: hypothetical protein [unclassified Exiguobacterium]
MCSQTYNGEANVAKEVEIDNYLYGRCHLFALLCSKMSGYDMEFLWDDDFWFEGAELPSKVLVHAYVVSQTGERYDAGGRLDDERLSEYDCNQPSFQNVTISQVESWMAENLLSDFEDGEVERLQEWLTTQYDYLSNTKNTYFTIQDMPEDHVYPEMSYVHHGAGGRGIFLRKQLLAYTWLYFSDEESKSVEMEMREVIGKEQGVGTQVISFLFQHFQLEVMRGTILHEESMRSYYFWRSIGATMDVEDEDEYWESYQEGHNVYFELTREGIMKALGNRCEWGIKDE